MDFLQKLGICLFVIALFMAIIGIFKLIVFLIKKALPKPKEDVEYVKQRAKALVESNEKLFIISKRPIVLGPNILLGIVAIGGTLVGIAGAFSPMGIGFFFMMSLPCLGLLYFVVYQLFGITKAYIYVTNQRVISEHLIWGKKLHQTIINKSDITKVTIVNTTLYFITISRNIIIKANKKTYGISAEKLELVAKAIKAK